MLNLDFALECLGVYDSRGNKTEDSRGALALPTNQGAKCQTSPSDSSIFSCFRFLLDFFTFRKRCRLFVYCW
jgi:hypothetical protein